MTTTREISSDGFEERVERFMLWKRLDLTRKLLAAKLAAARPGARHVLLPIQDAHRVLKALENKED